MTEDDDDRDGMPWSPAAFAQQMQKASEQAAESQQELFEQFLSANAGGFSDSTNLGPMSMGTATFKTRVQSGGRISIPDAEREALDIQEGDIVQTVVVPVKRNRSDTNE